MPMPRRFRPLLCGLLVGACASAQAADDLAFADNADLPSVLSATRLRQSLLDVPASVTIIDRQMIEQSGVREIPEILRLVPGMVVGYDSGSSAFVSYHGTSADLARRMQVLVDGRSIYQPNLASVDWISLPLDLADIERIEVVRGPNSAAFGANSFLGVVNIITRHPADVAGARAYTRQGENGIKDYFARLAGNGETLDWRISVAGRADEGFIYNAEPKEYGRPIHDSKELDSIYSRAVWTVNPESSLDVSFGYSGMSAEQQYRRDIYLETPVGEFRNGYLSLAWDQDLSADNHLRVQLNHSQFKRDEPWFVHVPPLAVSKELGALWQASPCLAGVVVDGDDPANCGTPTAQQQAAFNDLMTAIGNDPGLLDDQKFSTFQNLREHRTEIEVQDTWIVTDNLRAVYGGSFDRAVAQSDTYLQGRQENTVWRLFAHGEWRFAPSWLLNLGGSQEFDENAGNYFSPRAAINWQFLDNHVLRLVVSKAVRTPDILEEHADWRYNARAMDRSLSRYDGTYFRLGQAKGDAPTETILSREISYFGRIDPAALTLETRLFYDHLKLSEHQLDIDNFEIRPLEEHDLRGAEASVNWRPLPSQRLQLNYAYLDVTGNNENTDFVPKHSGSAGWWQDYSNGWQLGTTYYFYNNLRSYLYFDRLDLRLAKRIPLGQRQSLELAAVLQKRLSDDAELRKENGADNHKGWFSLDWRY